MKINRSYNAFLIFISLMLLQVSCTPESCFEETNAFMKANFFLSSTGKALAPDSLTAYGVDMSSFNIYDKAARIQPAQLPLNASASACSIVMRINGIQDTVTIWYSSFPHLISKECGYTFFHVIDSVRQTNNTIDDIIIRNRNVTTFKEENIRIFY